VAAGVFSQEEEANPPDETPPSEMPQRGSIPEELLRPRREEAPRYPIDTVIGTLGQGRAPREAYEIAQKAAAAFLAGNMNAPVFSSVNKVFLEGCMNKLETVSPRSFRLGGGREEPDGSYSFLVRFVGREQGITGELFIRFEERRPKPPPPADNTELDPKDKDDSADNRIEVKQIPLNNIPAERVWIFEDLILEEARSREVENRENRHRFDFPPYERIF